MTLSLPYYTKKVQSEKYYFSFICDQIIHLNNLAWKLFLAWGSLLLALSKLTCLEFRSVLLGFQVYGKDMFPMFRVINHKTDKNLAGVSPFFLPKLQSNFNFIGQDSKGATNLPEITFLNHKIIYKIVNEYTHLFYWGKKRNDLFFKSNFAA